MPPSMMLSGQNSMSMSMSMLSYIGIQKDRVKDRDENGLYPRIKSLLKDDPHNKLCAECRKEKSKWMSILQLPLHKEQTTMGVFVCNNCQAFHTALGEALCQVKSLKDPDSWTEEDVQTLENTANALVNSLYLSKLNTQTDKELGALATEEFVENKYKKCQFFEEHAYRQQMMLRDKLVEDKKREETQRQQRKLLHQHQNQHQDEDETEFSVDEDLFRLHLGGGHMSQHNNFSGHMSGYLGGVSTTSFHDSVSVMSASAMDDSMASQRIGRKERIARRRQSQSLEPGNRGRYGSHASLRVTSGSLLGGPMDASEMDESGFSTASSRLRRRSMSVERNPPLRRNKTSSSSRRGRSEFAWGSEPESDASQRRDRSRSRSTSKSRRSNRSLEAQETNHKTDLNLLFAMDESKAGDDETGSTDFLFSAQEMASQSKGDKSRRQQPRSILVEDNDSGETSGSNDDNNNDTRPARRGIRRTNSMGETEQGTASDGEGVVRNRTRKSISPMPPGRRTVPPKAKSNTQDANARIKNAKRGIPPKSKTADDGMKEQIKGARRRMPPRFRSKDEEQGASDIQKITRDGRASKRRGDKESSEEHPKSRSRSASRRNFRSTAALVEAPSRDGNQKNGPPLKRAATVDSGVNRRKIDDANSQPRVSGKGGGRSMDRAERKSSRGRQSGEKENGIEDKEKARKAHRSRSRTSLVRKPTNDSRAARSNSKPRHDKTGSDYDTSSETEEELTDNDQATKAKGSSRRPSRSGRRTKKECPDSGTSRLKSDSHSVSSRRGRKATAGEAAKKSLLDHLGPSTAARPKLVRSNSFDSALSGDDLLSPPRPSADSNNQGKDLLKAKSSHCRTHGGLALLAHGDQQKPKPEVSNRCSDAENASKNIGSDAKSSKEELSMSGHCMDLNVAESLSKSGHGTKTKPAADVKRGSDTSTDRNKAPVAMSSQTKMREALSMSVHGVDLQLLEALSKSGHGMDFTSAESRVKSSVESELADGIKKVEPKSSQTRLREALSMSAHGVDLKLAEALSRSGHGMDLKAAEAHGNAKDSVGKVGAKSKVGEPKSSQTRLREVFSKSAHGFDLKVAEAEEFRSSGDGGKGKKSLLQHLGSNDKARPKLVRSNSFDSALSSEDRSGNGARAEKKRANLPRQNSLKHRMRKTTSLSAEDVDLGPTETKSTSSVKAPSSRDLFSKIRGKPDMRACLEQAITIRDTSGNEKEAPTRLSLDSKMKDAASYSTIETRRDAVSGGLESTDGNLSDGSLDDKALAPTNQTQFEASLDLGALHLSFKKARADPAEEQRRGGRDKSKSRSRSSSKSLHRRSASERKQLASGEKIKVPKREQVADSLKQSISDFGTDIKIISEQLDVPSSSFRFSESAHLVIEQRPRGQDKKAANSKKVSNAIELTPHHQDADVLKTPPAPHHDSLRLGKQPGGGKGIGCVLPQLTLLSPWENIGFDDDTVDFPDKSRSRNVELSDPRLVPVGANLVTDDSSQSFDGDCSEKRSRMELGLDQTASDSEASFG